MKDDKDPKVVLINPVPRERSQFGVLQQGFGQEPWYDILVNARKEIWGEDKQEESMECRI